MKKKKKLSGYRIERDIRTLRNSKNMLVSVRIKYDKEE